MAELAALGTFEAFEAFEALEDVAEAVDDAWLEAPTALEPVVEAVTAAATPPSFSAPAVTVTGMYDRSVPVTVSVDVPGKLASDPPNAAMHTAEVVPARSQCIEAEKSIVLVANSNIEGPWVTVAVPAMPQSDESWSAGQLTAKTVADGAALTTEPKRVWLSNWRPNICIVVFWARTWLARSKIAARGDLYILEVKSVQRYLLVVRKADWTGQST